MIRHTGLIVAIAAAALLVLSPVVHAHLDQLTQVTTPDPLVQTWEAEALPRAGDTKVTDDAAARGGKAVLLNGEGAGFDLDFGRLPIGVHSVWVAAYVTDDDAIVQSIKLDKLAADDRQTRPLYLEMELRREGDAAPRVIRLRAPFPPQKQFEYITRIYFHTPVEARYSARLAVSRGTGVKQLAVDFVDLRNPLAELKFAPIKTKRVFVDDRDLPTMRASAARVGELPAPIRAQPLSSEQRKALDDMIWSDSIMPMNANPAQIYGPSSRMPAELAEAIKQRGGKAGTDVGKWITQQSATYENPWVLENKELNLRYTRADYDAGRTLPSPWPFPEDTGGYFFDKDQWGLTGSLNYGVIPAAIQSRYHVVLGALGATSQSPIGRSRFDLPRRYLLLGDLEAAADAAFLLAAYAYHYPGYDWNVHCLVNIMMVNHTFLAGNVRGRGCSYQGWSTGEVQGVIRAYDYLFPYIQGNQALADRLHRFIPWVNTPDDVVKLIDTFLVQRAALDGVRHILYAPIIPTAAVVLGPGETADHYLDQFVYGGNIYMRDSRSAFADNIDNGYSRDGMNFIGSTFYVVGESVGEMMENVDVLTRYVEAGGNRRFFLGDPKRFPRMAALPDGLLGIYTAGGHRIGVGDVVDPQSRYMPWQHLLKDENLEPFAKGWTWTRDPRYAWVLANRRGQGSLADKAWQQILDAARDQRDPLLHTESRVLEGFGVARMEANVDATDPRLKMSTIMRFGVGSGHAHPDTLDIEVYAHGIRATSDLGGRQSGLYGRPSCMTTYMHNLVQVDDRNFNNGPQNSTAYGWLTAFKPGPLASFTGGAACADAQPQVSSYRRGVLQVLADPGSADRPALGYVFDVLRVRGGKTHTWCFHGCVSDDFQINAELQPAASEDAVNYLRSHRKGTAREGVTPNVLEATWRLRRTAEEIDGIPVKNAEKEILHSLYDESSPRKFTRVRLFGREGDKVLSGNWYANGARKHTFPVLHIRRESSTDLDSVYPAIIEPYAGEPLITNAGSVTLEGGAVAMLLTTRLGQIDGLFSAPERGKVYQVNEQTTASGDVVWLSKDDKGIRGLIIVGGTELTLEDLAVKIDAAERTAVVKSYNAQANTATLDATWPAGLVGQIVTAYPQRRGESFKIAAVKDKQVTFDRPTVVYRGAAAYVDPKGQFVQLDAVPSLASYHPSYYDGMTAFNEAGQMLGKVKLTLGDRLWYTGWPESRRHLARINPEDLTDANGDGKVTVGMFVNALAGPTRRFAEDGETVLTLQAGEKMLDLEVTRVADEGYLLYTRQHPREFLDALKTTHPGWPYHQQFIRNERGDKQWVVNMPGDTYQLEIAGRKLTPADFPDRNKDGRAMIELHAMGPGDQLSIPTSVQVRRLEAEGEHVYEVTGDVGCTFTMQATTVELRDAKGGWNALPTQKPADRQGQWVTFKLAEEHLADGSLVLRLK